MSGDLHNTGCTSDFNALNDNDKFVETFGQSNEALDSSRCTLSLSSLFNMSWNERCIVFYSFHILTYSFLVFSHRDGVLNCLILRHHIAWYCIWDDFKTCFVLRTMRNRILSVVEVFWAYYYARGTFQQPSNSWKYIQNNHVLLIVANLSCISLREIDRSTSFGRDIVYFIACTPPWLYSRNSRPKCC